MSNETEKQPEKNGPPAVREIRVVTDTGPLAYIWDTARFEHAFRIATAMAQATLIPDHLRQTRKDEPFATEQIRANCFRIVNQALRWGVDPFSIVDDTYVVGGKLCYQSKVIAALVNTKAPLKERLKKSYTGTKGQDDYTVHITGVFIGEEGTASLSVGDAKTENSMWKKDPQLKLWYSGVIRWAREFTPELVVGIFTDDDAERMEEWRKIPQGLSQSAGNPVRTDKPEYSAPKKAKARTVPSPSKAESDIADQAAQEVVGENVEEDPFA
jgi:hypothetical protein